MENLFNKKVLLYFEMLSYQENVVLFLNVIAFFFFNNYFVKKSKFFCKGNETFDTRGIIKKNVNITIFSP